MFVRFMLVTATGLAIGCLLVAGHPAAAEELFGDDFEGGLRPAWSTTVTDPTTQAPVGIDVTPAGGRHFLGRFGKQTVWKGLMRRPVAS